MPRSDTRNSPGPRNIVAALITVLSVGVLYSSFDPLPAGEENISVKPPPMPEIDETRVPIPPDAPSSSAASESEESTEASIIARADAGEQLSNEESIRYCLMLLENGQRYISNFPSYRVTFHKEERIGGDMKSPQSINMKVQHGPHFAVYMKWLTGEKGQQVLYSDEYEDGCMVVKFGGFRRLLPALRLDPTSSIAMAETRYPVTEAGIGGMIRQIVKHRKRDLDHGGVSCSLLADNEFEGRKCRCFVLNYENKKASDTYRKSILMLDAERNIPVLVRNYTWAADSSLAGEELDQVTLIENYSFTDLDVERQLVAKDFSRENPGYRM